MWLLVFQLFVINDAAMTVFVYVIHLAQGFLWSRVEVKIVPGIFLKALLLMKENKSFCYSVY